MLRPVQRAQHGAHGGELDVRVHARAPAGFAIGVLDLNVSNRNRLFAGTQGVLAVIGNFKTRHPGFAETVDERGERAVAFAGKFHRLAVAQEIWRGI